MNFYKLDSSASPKIIGRFPQCQGVEGVYDFGGQNSIWKILHWEPIDPEIVFPIFKLHRSAKLTDFISYSFADSKILMLISIKLRDVLLQHKLPKYQIFNVQVLHKTEFYDYCIFYLSEFNNEFIDFERTQFYLSTALGLWIEPLNINSIESYENIKSSLKEKTFISISKLVLKDHIDFDFFRVYGPMFSSFVSEDLYQAIVREGIKGIEFKALETLQIPIFSAENMQRIQWNQEQTRSNT